MRIFTFLLMMMFITSLSMAQNAPINFETGGFGADWTWTVFENGTNPALEIIDNPHSTGINTSAKVAKFTALQTGQAHAGVESFLGNLGTFEWNSNNRIVKIMVYKTVISDVGIKFDGGPNPNDWSSGEIKVANTLINQWEELTFDFSLAPNPPAGVGGLKRIIIFPDFSARTQDNIIYFDNITFNQAGSTPDVPATAAPAPPTREATDVISIFSNAYTNVENTNFNPGWGQSTIVTTTDISGNATLKYANFNFQGTQFDNPLNITGMETLHIDMWTANATTVNISCISTGPVEKAYSLPVTANQWVSYDIPLTEFTGVNLADIIQFKFDGGTGTQTIYLDNIYFYKSGSVVDQNPNAPIDFETGGFGANWTWTVFENATNPALEIVANPYSTGINTSATVAKFTALQAGNPWAGVESAHGSADLGPFVLDATNSTIKIMVWKPVISDVGIKLVAAGGWAQPEIKKANTVVNAWEELTFDFSAYLNPPEAEGHLDQIVIFPDWGSAARGQDNIIYFDNITFSAGGAAPTDPTTAGPTPPARNPADVISLFSDAYTNVTVDTWRTSWSSATLEDVSIAGNATKKYSALDFVGIETVANQLDISGMTHLHIDVWSANFTLFGIKLVDFGPNGIYQGTPNDDTEHQVDINSPAQGEWVSLDIPLSNFTGLTTRKNLAQYILVGRPAGTPIVYVDNMYFYKDSQTGIEDLSSNQKRVQVYPNPVKSGELVQLSAAFSQIDVMDFSGRIINSIKAGSLLETNELKQGVYILRIQTNDGGVQIQKLVVK